jgi:hypothetical protein
MIRTREQKADDRRELSDYFLEKVISVLNLGDFRFTREKWNTELDVNNKQILELEQLCNENKNKREKYNQENNPDNILNIGMMNVNWSYETILLYFNIEIL